MKENYTPYKKNFKETTSERTKKMFNVLLVDEIAEMDYYRRRYKKSTIEIHLLDRKVIPKSIIKEAKAKIKNKLDEYLK